KVGPLDSVQNHVHRSEKVGQRLQLPSVKGLLLELLELIAGEIATPSEMVGRGAEETRSSKAGIIGSLARFRSDNFHHGADDVALRIEFTGVPRRVRRHSL